MTDGRATLLQLRQQFVLRSREDLAALTQHVQAKPLTPEELYLTVHRLAGAGGTFGFPEVSIEAELVEAELLDGADGTGSQLDPLIAALSSAVSPSLDVAAANARSVEPPAEPGRSANGDQSDDRS